jgi:hypothetical protein
MKILSEKNSPSLSYFLTLLQVLIMSCLLPGCSKISPQSKVSSQKTESNVYFYWSVDPVSPLWVQDLTKSHPSPNKTPTDIEFSSDIKFSKNLFLNRKNKTNLVIAIFQGTSLNSYKIISTDVRVSPLGEHPKVSSDPLTLFSDYLEVLDRNLSQGKEAPIALAFTTDLLVKSSSPSGEPLRKSYIDFSTKNSTWLKSHQCKEALNWCLALARESLTTQDNCDDLSPLFSGLGFTIGSSCQQSLPKAWQSFDATAYQNWKDLSKAYRDLRAF